jgi:hypothetical protein
LFVDASGLARRQSADGNTRASAGASTASEGGPGREVSNWHAFRSF